MLIKKSDDQSEQISRLERRVLAGGPDAQWAQVDLRNRRAGIRGEDEAAYLINFGYANSPNWAVIHDLRVEYNGRTAQIDHLLINRWLDIYVLETKHFHAGVKITDDGEFLRWNNFEKRYEGMPSPIEQNMRHVEVLRDLLSSIDLPKRVGLTIKPSIQSYILISENSRIIRPKPKKFDTSKVVKPGQLKSKIWREIDSANIVFSAIKIIGKTVSSKTVEDLARKLVDHHRPVFVKAASAEKSPQIKSVWARLGDKIERANESVGFARGKPVQAQTGQSVAALCCKQCSDSRGRVLSGKFGYYFKCGSCNTNTPIRFSCIPGHSPRLRKDGQRFYRDCSDCGSSSLYYQNKR